MTCRLSVCLSIRPSVLVAAASGLWEDMGAGRLSVGIQEGFFGHTGQGQIERSSV